MTEYHLIKVHLSEGQLAKCRSALKNHTSLSIRVSPADLGHGNSHLSLTERQRQSLAKKAKAGNGATLSISHAALKHAEIHGAGFGKFMKKIGSTLIRAAGNAIGDHIEGKGVRCPLPLSETIGDAFKGHGIKRKKVKGKGILSRLGGAAARGLGNVIGSAIEGSGVKRDRVTKPKRKTGKGFISRLCGGAARGIGNLVGSAIEGSGIKRKKQAKACESCPTCGHGIYATGYGY